jgi:TonB family protein
MAAVTFRMSGLRKVEATGGANSKEDYDTAPEFNGDLMAYLGKHIVYPKAAKDKKIEGKVMMKFAVDEKGNIGDIEVLGQPNELLAASATDVVKNMPKWRPGTKNGKPTTVTYMLPISYKLN